MHVHLQSTACWESIIEVLAELREDEALLLAGLLRFQLTSEAEPGGGVANDEDAVIFEAPVDEVPMSEGRLTFVLKRLEARGLVEEGPRLVKWCNLNPNDAVII